MIHLIKGIVKNGYKILANPKRFKNKREVYGPGIYSSPDPDFALDGWYAEHFNFKGRRFQVLVENLVNMTNTVVREHKKPIKQ